MTLFFLMQLVTKDMQSDASLSFHNMNDMLKVYFSHQFSHLLLAELKRIALHSLPCKVRAPVLV